MCRSLATMVFPVILESWSVVLSGRQEVEPMLTSILLMWQFVWMCVVLWCTRAAEQGSGDQAGENRVPWEVAKGVLSFLSSWERGFTLEAQLCHGC